MRIALLIPFLTPMPALAASPIAEVLCEPSQRMSERLSLRSGATKASSGLRNPEEIMELWLDPAGDWTMVIAYASGTSCIVAMGEAWFDLPRDPA
ncbi:hypothetical protein KO516_06330 [Citreicella sp. C3M06]|uniref:hypothetical protein n=1 Tax=Roseobacteraceae TaxID=2854170 RepID=UPI001C08044D|nr:MULTISPECIES: hypothetical protein [Roseobacteraceae]MBU2960438.1 hypothetical protein [Citreicella sp. C3M06]MDO6587458.1 hypothetical protein [Salipiger sp. 1_MG-2023]